jgi:Tfp pilus assembly major pilin PilA
MKFISLLESLEQKLGYHHIPFNRDAGTLQDLFDGTPVQSDFVIRFVRSVYKKNQCVSLDSKITRKKTEDCLAEIRLATLKSKNVDIDTFNFIEDLCQAIDKIFNGATANKVIASSNKTGANDIPGQDQKASKSSIVSINQRRHRRWLKSSA